MDSLVYQILKTKSIVSYLERKGHNPVKQLSGGRLSYLCPFVDHKESKPSFMVWTNAEFENFHCFGCFHEDAQVLLHDFTMKSIIDLKVSDRVMGHDGLCHSVIRKLKRKYDGTFVNFQCSKNRKLLTCTKDHNLYVLPYVTKHIRPNRSGAKYSHFNYRYAVPEKKRANEIRVGDCLCVPITNRVCDIKQIDVNPRLEKFYNHYGPRVKQFAPIEMSEDFLFLAGVYLAEGSTTGRVLRFSLHSKEKELADRIVRSLDSIFKVKARSFVPNKRPNSLEITCCNKLLTILFSTWFGQGCQNKHIPDELFYLPNDKLRYVVDGYFTGDGYLDKRASKLVPKSNGIRRCETVSCALANQLFDILNRFQFYPSFYSWERAERKTIYCVSWHDVAKKTPGIVGYYKKHKDSLFYCLPVCSSSESRSSGYVYNLSISDSHSYTVSLFAVGNCQRGYSIVHLVAALEGVAYRKAVEILGEGVEVSLEEDVRLQMELLNKRLSRGGNSEDIARKLLTIGTRCRYHLESVDQAESEVEIVDRFYEVLDGFILDLNFEAVDSCFDQISSILRLRQIKFSGIHKEALQKQYQEAE